MTVGQKQMLFGKQKEALEPIFRYYGSICLKRTRKTMKMSRYSASGLRTEPSPEYGAKVLTIKNYI
jgi:hypothetical protein